MNAAYLTPAITLFNQDGTLDLESQERLFNNLIDQGIDGILVEGSSSEFFAMPMDQRREMAKFAIEKVNHRVKLIIGTSHMAQQIHGNIYIYNFPDNTGYTIPPETVPGQDPSQYRGHEGHGFRHGPYPGADQDGQVPYS